ncbi:hypothetical protein FISHEDRAFT_40051 [Fistulina hepatica ATCC 64428]|uniref:CBF1-interacting co-repressor CIR N-terminal domain-containing protein n=1 Tax=Fistulina hepatica ATCC 64428 TaxID=1128425 RepID=A0A0D7AGW5_9AGAR|nr:hypothetical protein FISHEDRAFT_40051 [Fistulina hepatica ATCC 64428]
MGKLNIAHHKSYHPYRRDNIERVRRDEEEARQKEANEEGKMMLADSEARIELLRERAGVSKPHKKRKNDDMAMIASSSTLNAEASAALPTTNGHINFFEDLEQSSIAAAIQASNPKRAGTQSTDTDKGFALAPSEKDRNPWYSASTAVESEADAERRNRDTARKSVHDPLSSITRQLASRSASEHRPLSSSSRPMPPPPRRRGSLNGASGDSRSSEVVARLSRESSERERALALIQRKKREMDGSATPSTVHGGSEYGDVYNRREVENARDMRRRGQHRSRRWDDDR